MPGSRRVRRPEKKNAQGGVSKWGSVSSLPIEKQAALLSTIFAHSSDAMAFVDPDFVIRTGNEAYAKRLGIPLARIIGHSLAELFPGCEAQVARIYQTVRESGVPFKVETSLSDIKDQPERGSVLGNAVVLPVHESDGVLLGYLLMYHDIAEERPLMEARRQAEAVRQRANELEVMIESIADAVFVCDASGRIVQINQAGLRLTGLSEETAMVSLYDLIPTLNLHHADGRPLVREEMVLSRALQGETIRNYEEIAWNAQTQRDVHLWITVAPIHDQEGRIAGAVEVMSDISRIRELDRLKDEFIYVAAHELKTPIAIMKGYAQAMMRSPEAIPAPNLKMLRAIDRGADRIDQIVKDLLDISRLHLGHLALTLERFDLTELAGDVVTHLALTTTKHHLNLVEAEPVVVEGDRARLEQVLVNLIDNAIKYSPGGGTIDVRVAVSGPSATVSVKDQGVGIPEDRQEHIFERFYRAHTMTPYDFGGIGVGLHISNEIVALHSGRMWFESKPGQGSTFHFAIPLQVEHANL